MTTKFSPNTTPQPTPPVCRKPPAGAPPPIPSAFHCAAAFDLNDPPFLISTRQHLILPETSPGSWHFHFTPPNPCAYFNVTWQVDTFAHTGYMYAMYHDPDYCVGFEATWNTPIAADPPYAPPAELVAGDLITGRFRMYPYA